MRKFIIAGMALAMLAVPAAASASVNVDDSGTGFVGKGDVQDALGLANDAAMQDPVQEGNGVKFTTGYTKVDTTCSTAPGTFPVAAS